MKAKDEPLCALPCTRWVPPKSGWFTQLDAARADDVVTVPVPDEIPLRFRSLVNHEPARVPR